MSVWNTLLCVAVKVINLNTNSNFHKLLRVHTHMPNMSPPRLCHLSQMSSQWLVFCLVRTVCSLFIKQSRLSANVHIRIRQCMISLWLKNNLKHPQWVEIQDSSGLLTADTCSSNCCWLSWKVFTWLKLIYFPFYFCKFSKCFVAFFFF